MHRKWIAGKQHRVTIFRNMELRKRYNIGQDKDPNAEITVGMSSDEPEPVNCKELLKKTFAPELDFDW